MCALTRGGHRAIDAPTPAEAKVTLPGFAFAYAMSSCAPAKSRDLFFTFRRWRPRGRTIEQVFVDSGLAGKRDALTRTLYYGEQRQLELALTLPARMGAKPAGPCAIMCGSAARFGAWATFLRPSRAFQRPREAHAGLKTALGGCGFLSGALYGHLRLAF